MKKEDFKIRRSISDRKLDKRAKKEERKEKARLVKSVFYSVSRRPKKTNVLS